VRYAGGHDPGPLALPAPEVEPAATEQAAPEGAAGPWGGQPAGKPFLPGERPVSGAASNRPSRR